MDREGRAGVSYFGGKIALARVGFRRNVSNTVAGVYALLLFDAAYTGAEVTIEDCSFEANEAVGHVAPDIHIESTGTLAIYPQQVTISRCVFSQSNGGSVALLGLRLGVASRKSLISACRFLATAPTVQGVVFSTHISGHLFVTGSEFLDCKSVSQDSGNCGVYVLSSTSSEAIPTNTVVERCRFQHAAGGSCITLEANALQKPSLETHFCEFLHNFAQGALNSGGFYSDDSSVFVNNTANYGAGFQSHESSVSSLRNSTFQNNTSVYEGGAVSISGPESKAVLTDCQMSNNAAGMKGGAGTFENDIELTIVGAVVRENRAASASAFYFGDIKTTAAVIANTTIERNTGEMAILAIEAHFEFRAVIVRSNFPIDTEAGIELMLSVFHSENSVFEHLIGNSGCMISMVLESEWHDHGSRIQSSFCLNTVIEAQLSSLTFNETYLANLTAKNIAVVYAERGSSISIKGALFEGNTALLENSSVLYSDDSGLRVASTEFLRSTGTNVYVTNCPFFRLENSKVSQAHTVADAQVVVLSTPDVRILSTQFEKLAGRLAGGLLIRNDDEDGEIVISDSGFRNCSGSSGGVALHGVSGTVQSTHFTYNTASDFGGGLYVNCSRQLTVAICTFEGNSAHAGGGGVYWTRAAPLITDSTYIQNSALYGCDAASVASRLEMRNRTSALLDSFPSGHVITTPLEFNLIDSLNQTVTTDSDSYAKLVPVGNESLVSGNSDTESQLGVLSFQGFAIAAPPGQSHNFTIKVDSTSMLPFNFTLFFRSCERGEILLANACSVCPQTTYSLAENSSLCMACPDGAECLGGIEVYPKKGYWRASVSSDRLWECFSADACLGHQDYNSLLGICTRGYTGQICQSCEPGFARTGRDDCSMCSGLSLTMLRVTGLSICGVVFMVLLVRSTMSNVKSNKFTSVYYRIFLNYLQLTILTTTFDLKWPKIAKLIFNTQDAVGGASQEFFSYDCVYYEIGLDEAIVYQDLIVVSAIPLVSAVFTSVIWLAISLIKRDSSYMRQQNILSIIVIFFVLYTKLVNSVFSLFNCFNIDNTLWLRGDMALKCWDNHHSFYSLAVAVPSIVIWIFGAPLCVLAILRWSKDRLQLASVKLRYGFMYMGYAPDFFFWEFVILARKIVVLSVFVFTSTSPVQLQALTVLIVLLVALLLQLKFRPFVTDELNRLEFKAIFTTAVTLICGLYYLASGLSTWLQLFLLVLIISANAYFLGSWGKSLLRIYAFHAVAYCPSCCLRMCGWVPSIRSIIVSEHPRVFPIKAKYEQEVELDDLSSADLSNSHRDRSKVAPDPVTFMIGVSAPPTPPSNTPDELAE